ncbi:MAG TPA: hypothetical protein VF666_15290 [Pyrinomonadaceae bacterium]|jgi:hypothetical protein
MDNESSLTLRAKAMLTWKRERPLKEAARIEQQARLVEAVRRKLLQMFGSEYEIKVGIVGEERITASVEEIRFNTCIYNEDVITIIPIERCLYCGRDVTLGSVDDLADLGKALEELEQGQGHQCILG